MRETLRKFMLFSSIFSIIGGLIWLQNDKAGAFGAASLVIGVLQAITWRKLKTPSSSQTLLMSTIIGTLLLEIAGVIIKGLLNMPPIMMIGTLPGLVSVALGIQLLKMSRKTPLGLIASEDSSELDPIIGDSIPTSQRGKSNFGSEIHRILAFEPTRALANPSLTIAALSFLTGCAWATLSLTSSESPEQQMVVMLVMRLLNEDLFESLRTAHKSQVILLTFVIFITPPIAMFFGSNQLSGDVGRKHIRFLAPRLGRPQLFIARALGGWLMWALMALPIVVLSTLAVGLWGIDNSTYEISIWRYSIQAGLLIALYGMPFIALMSWTNSITRQPNRSFATGLFFWITIISLALLGEYYVTEELIHLEYLFPTSIKYMLLSNNTADSIKASTLAILYTSAFLAIGLKMTQKRDL